MFIYYIWLLMQTPAIHINPGVVTTFIVRDTRACFISSFTEFFPFCPKLYYFSTFKDFSS